MVGLIGLVLDSELGVDILLGSLSLLSIGFSLGGDFSFELGVGLIEVSALSQDDHDLSSSLVLAHSSLGLDACDFSVLVVHENSSQVDGHGDKDLASSMHFKGSELVLEQLLGQEDVELEVAITSQIDQVRRRSLSLLLHLGLISILLEFNSPVSLLLARSLCLVLLLLVSLVGLRSLIFASIGLHEPGALTVGVSAALRVPLLSGRSLLLTVRSRLHEATSTSGADFPQATFLSEAGLSRGSSHGWLSQCFSGVLSWSLSEFMSVVLTGSFSGILSEVLLVVGGSRSGLSGGVSLHHVSQ